MEPAVELPLLPPLDAVVVRGLPICDMDNDVGRGLACDPMLEIPDDVLLLIALGIGRAPAPGAIRLLEFDVVRAWAVTNDDGGGIARFRASLGGGARSGFRNELPRISSMD